MPNEVVLYEKEGSLGISTVNRPESMNPLNMEVFRALSDVFDEVSRDDEVRVLIITGAGKAFVAGADIKELLSYDLQTGWIASRFQQAVFSKLENMGKPSIALINGFAMGGGLELALSCTLRLASEKAKLGFPELGLGIIPAFGGTQRLVRTVGHAKAMELLLLRTILDAREASRIGLVNAVVEEDQTFVKAKEWAHNLASLSATVVRLELELLARTQDTGFESGLALESSLAALAVSTPEAKHLLAQFVAKGKNK
jgi:enoyl-CoA hydratase